MYPLLFLRGAVVALLLTPVLSQSRPSTDGCVDPKGLDQCIDTSISDFTQCGVKCNSTSQIVPVSDCLYGCGILRDASYVGCQVQSCWNKVYGCEYQAWMINFIIDGRIAPEQFTGPFFPAPENAPGACSCNLGYAYANLTMTFFDNPCLEAAKTGTAEYLQYCQCCETTRHLSAALNTCPDSDLSILGIQAAIQNVADHSQTIDCSPVLNSNNCSAEFGMPIPAGTEFYNVFNFPSGLPGTKALSDVGSLTTFPSEPTLTVLLPGGYTSVVTLAPWDEKAASQPAGTTKTISQTSTATASGQTSTSTNGGKTSAASKDYRSASLAMLIASWTIYVLL